MCGAVFGSNSAAIAEAALIEKEEVEPGEVRRDQGELLAQRRLRQAQCSRDGEPIGCDAEEHDGAVIAPAGEIKAGDEHANADQQRARVPLVRYNKQEVLTPLERRARSAGPSFAAAQNLKRRLAKDRHGHCSRWVSRSLGGVEWGDSLLPSFSSRPRCHPRSANRYSAPAALWCVAL
jgi:hypothetical protein